ncbi:hypothetical protein IE53DRAFT_385439 [Violaceomyces palustris]|uniref:Uncharacterized protein n=1 Tax=Violaceomyces palustris TaxID=1673888 RepID=A0ACD0P204_9BASI|nr:hypothetical protein IE53DRAFT_385439 [Violaceomyces palustris]
MKPPVLRNKGDDQNETKNKNVIPSAKAFPSRPHLQRPVPVLDTVLSSHPPSGSMELVIALNFES